MRESTPPNEKVLRLRYIRVLEKFFTRALAFLKNQDFNPAIFKKNIDKYYEDIKKVKAVRLDSEYLNMLEEFVNSTLSKTAKIDDDFSEQKEALLKEANLVHKEKNKSNYKKDKHKSKDFYDGY
ncbi:MAG: hypothetical protein PHF17_04875 [Arcobacteraceae bacterium]|jgi:hypothetical protein|nr:hypothetical protein [Arcobacteraceae bacterium]